MIKTEYDLCVDRLLSILPKNQIEDVFSQSMVDIDYNFIGFIDTYEFLSKLIPTHFTVIDFGCAYAPQCFYFQNHKEYIGVDIDEETVRFKTENFKYYSGGVGAFIQENIGKFDINETFAILNYNPLWGEDDKNIVQKSFKNLYCYYPHGGHNVIPKLLSK